MDRILEYSRPRAEDGTPGNLLHYKTQTIEIRTLSTGQLYLFQEAPQRKHLSRLLPIPQLGDGVFSMDIIRPDGGREYFVLKLEDDRAILGSPKYNNWGSGHTVSARPKGSHSRMRKIPR